MVKFAGFLEGIAELERAVPKLTTTLSVAEAVGNAARIEADTALSVAEAAGNVVRMEAYTAKMGSATSRQLTDRYRLPGLEALQKHIEPDSAAMADIRKFEGQGHLNFFTLGNYIDENPSLRTGMVTDALRAGAPEPVRNWIRFSVFPEPVADKLALAANSAAVNAGTIVHYARDLESGPRFVQYLTDHVEQGKPITQEAIDKINQSASTSTEPINPFKNRPVKVGGHLRLIDGGPHLDQVRTITDLAQGVNQTADIIAAKFDPKTPIALLWRDMGPLAAPLSARGRQVINFHWSRAQYFNPRTFDRWLREVPPNSVAIDAGLGGSILGRIRAVDETADLQLLQSGGRYPQILPRTQLLQIAEDLEVMPKIVGRCTGFTTGARASLCRPSREDSQDIVPPSLLAVPWNRALLSDMGLSDWHVWRYKTFSAVPLSERVGISKPERIDQYLKRNSYLRGD